MIGNKEEYGKYSRLRPDFIIEDTNAGILDSEWLNLFGCFDLDDLFNKSQGTVINIMNDTSESVSDHLLSKIVHDRDGELGFTPKCDCGKYASRKYEGMICPKCGTKVKTDFIDKVSHEYWIEIPEHFPPMIHPVWYWQLQKISGLNKGKGGGNLADYLFNPDVSVPINLQHIIPPDRSLTWFYENHETLFNYLFNPDNKFPSKVKISLAWLKLFYEEYKDVLFTRHFPILHSSLHPLLGNKDSHFKKGDKTVKNIFKAVTDIMVTHFSLTKGVQRRSVLEVKLLKVFDELMKYYLSIVKTKLNNKRGILRQHNLGSRCHFTYRAVCTPIQGPHEIDEIELPWKVIVGSLKHELVNLLVNRHGLGMNEALGRIFKALVDEDECDELIRNCIQTLIDECPWKGLPVLIGRNPTLRHGSIMLNFLTKVPNDAITSSLGVSPLSITNMNADFKVKLSQINSK